MQNCRVSSEKVFNQLAITLVIYALYFKTSTPFDEQGNSLMTVGALDTILFLHVHRLMCDTFWWSSMLVATFLLSWEF